MGKLFFNKGFFNVEDLCQDFYGVLRLFYLAWSCENDRYVLMGRQCMQFPLLVLSEDISSRSFCDIRKRPLALGQRLVEPMTEYLHIRQTAYEGYCQEHKTHKK